MLPHHQAAMSLAKIELKYGTDKELKKFIRQLVDMKDKQIDFMRSRLSHNGDK